MKVEHKVLVGNQVFSITVKGKKVGEKIALDVKDLALAQKDLARSLLMEAFEYDQALANFVLNVVGVKGSVVAECLSVTPSHISQLRKGKGCSAQFWKFFRVAMITLLAEKRDRDIEKVLVGRLID